MDEHLAASHRALGKRRFQWPSFLTAGIGASFFGFSLELFGFEGFEAKFTDRIAVEQLYGSVARNPTPAAPHSVLGG